MTCPLCDTLSDQWWRELYLQGYGDDDDYQYTVVPNLLQASCTACREKSYWFGDRMIYPPARTGPEAHSDMPAEVLELYREAQAVASVSPRAAAVLLRVALERLMAGVGHEERSLNAAIRAYVAEGGVPTELQQAMDTVRVTGNDAAHPGSLRLDDTPGGVAALFEIVNELVDRLVGFKARMSRIYGNLDSAKRAEIDKRDGRVEVIEDQPQVNDST